MNHTFRKRGIIGLVSIAVLCLGVLLFSHRGSGFSGCEEGCEKCHNLSNEEVKVILDKVKAADARILKIQMSPVKGLWEVAIENKGQRGLLYVDFSKKHLVSGSIVEVNAALNKTKERIDELNKDKKINPASIPLKDALLLGSSAAQKRAIVFTDPD